MSVIKLRTILSLVLGLFSITASAQTIPRKVVSEYFTNTWCSICASRNPGFFNNIRNQANAFHISYHPSSPFNGCILNQHNVTGNDGRTQHYGVFGSTPRLVIQGTVIPGSTNYSMASIFNPYLNQTSDFKLDMQQTKFGTDSITIQVNVIRLNSTNSLTQADLYVCLVEDTVFYTGPNNEPRHFHVFRRALTANAGLRFNISDTVSFSFTTLNSTIWNLARIQAAAILQQVSNKQVLQAEMLNPSGNGSVTGLGNDFVIRDIGLHMYPNPANSKITVKIHQQVDGVLRLHRSDGAVVRSWVWDKFEESVQLDLNEVSTGMYFLVFQGKGIYASKSLIVK